MNNDDLDQVLQSLDAEQCVRALSGLAEGQRKQLSQRALQWLIVSRGHHLHNAELNTMLPPEATERAAIEPARAAVLGTCTLQEVKKHNGH